MCELGVAAGGAAVGAPAYHPRVPLGVWLWGCVSGTRSSRKLERACSEQLPYRWLTGWQRPDHHTPWRSYRDHRQAMPEPTFGVLKEEQAARRFLLRGLYVVEAAWSLLAVAFNLRTLARIRRTSDRFGLPAAA